MGITGIDSDPIREQRLAAVLIPIIEIEETWHFLYTQRSEHLDSHRGQVSFPGGAWEEADENLKATALRETWEEIGITSEKIEVLGCLDPRLLLSGFLVTPVIAKVSWPVALNINRSEVEKVFSIPFPWLLKLENRYIKEFEWVGNKYPVVYFKPYEGEILWGATASMTLEVLQKLELIREETD